MDLDRDFAQAELSADLLVDQAADHEIHDFAFAGAKLLKTIAQGGNLCVFLAPDPITLQALVNRGQEVLFLEGLHQKLDGACLHRARGHGNVTMSGDKDDGNGDAGLLEKFLEVEPGHAGQTNVEHQAAGCSMVLLAWWTCSTFRYFYRSRARICSLLLSLLMVCVPYPHA